MSSSNPLAGESAESARVPATPTWLWAAVGGVVLVALAAGGIAGFQYGRQYERTQGCPNCITPDETFWLLGASLRDSQQDVLIQQVASGGPADSSGLRDGDRLITIDDQPVNSAAEGRRILHSYGSGATANFTIERSHVVHQVNVTLGGVIRIEPPIVYPPVTVEPPIIIYPPGNYGERNLGVTYKMLEPGDPSGVSSGAMLIQVWSGGPADSAGLVPGDIILAVDDHDLSTYYTLEDALNTGRYRTFVALKVRKVSGRTATLRVALTGKPYPYPEQLPYEVDK